MKYAKELVVLALLLVLLLSSMYIPYEQLLTQAHGWSENNAPLAGLIIGGIFFLSVMLLLPVAPSIMLSGFVLGLIKGFLVIWVTSLLAASLAFWISRTFARPWVERRFMTKPNFQEIDRAIKGNGLQIALLVRLASVLPYGPVNYSLGASSLEFRDYLIGTALGALPSFIVVVYLGTTFRDFAGLLAGDIEIDTFDLILGLAGLVAAGVIIWFIVRAAQKALRKEIHD